MPHWLLRRVEVNSTTKLIYGILALRSGKKGHCWWSQKKLATELGLNPKKWDTIYRALRKLRALKLIVAQRSAKRRSNLYRFLCKKEWIESRDYKKNSKKSKIKSNTDNTVKTQSDDSGKTQNLIIKDKKEINNKIADYAAILSKDPALNEFNRTRNIKTILNSRNTNYGPRPLCFEKEFDIANEECLGCNHLFPCFLKTKDVLKRTDDNKIFELAFMKSFWNILASENATEEKLVFKETTKILNPDKILSAIEKHGLRHTIQTIYDYYEKALNHSDNSPSRKTIRMLTLDDFFELLHTTISQQHKDTDETNT